jgi:hypothetical protein
LYGKRSAADLPDRIGARFRALRIADIGDRNVHPRLGEGSRYGAADVAGASGDESRFSAELHDIPL